MRIFNKIKSSFWLNSMLFTMMLRFSLVLFGAFSFMLLARFFSNEDMGYWSLFTIATTTIELTKGGLLRNAMIKYLHSNEFSQHKDAVQSGSLIINAGFTLLMIVLIAVGAGWFSHFVKAPVLQPLLYWSSLLFIVLIPFNHMEILLQSNFRYQINFNAYMIRQGIFFLFLIICWLLFPSFITFYNLLTVQIISVAIAVVYMYVKTKPYLHAKLTYNKKTMMRLLNFGRYVFGTALFGNISRSIDQVVTANILNVINPNAVSYYNAVARVSNMMDSPTNAAADILFPKNAQASEMEGLDKVKYYFERMVATLTALIIPLGLLVFLFPKLILFIIAGSKYYPAIPILQLMAASSFIRPFIYNFGHTLDAIGKPRINFRVNVGLMIFYTGVTYLFLHIFGLMGAAYASIVMNTTSFFIFYYLLHRYLNISLRNIFVYTKQTYIDLYQLCRKYIFRKTIETNEPA